MMDAIAQMFDFSGLFTVSGLFTLLMLFLLQAVLGFDNLLYIVIESNKVGNEDDARKVRNWGIGIAVALRLVLLVLLVALIGVLGEPLFGIPANAVLNGEFTFQALITLFGGMFIIYTAVKEINHLLIVDHVEHSEGSARRSVWGAIALIVTVNLVFSVDSILSAMAIASVQTEVNGVLQKTYQVPLMMIAIVASGIAMIALAGYVTDFLKKNRMYQVLGLFILFLVGVLLVTEGAHLAHIDVFGYKIEAMSKSSFYLVIFVLVITDILSDRYQRRLWAQREAELTGAGRGAQAGLDAVNARKKVKGEVLPAKEMPGGLDHATPVAE